MLRSTVTLGSNSSLSNKIIHQFNYSSFNKTDQKIQIPWKYFSHVAPERMGAHFFPFVNYQKYSTRDRICGTWGSETLVSTAGGDVTDAVIVESTVGSSLGCEGTLR